MVFGAGAQTEALTVVVPTLNSEDTLDWTLASLRSAREIRVIVADSFSTDSTLDICKRWNVETISVPAGNMYAAINAGLRKADTDWLAYVNSDDWIFTAPYIRMLRNAIATSADVVYGGADYVDEFGRFLFSMRPALEETALRVLRAGYLPFCQPAAMFRRTAFAALNGFDEQYRAASDFDFFYRAALLNLRFKRLDFQPVVAFRLHSSQISSQQPELDRIEKKSIKTRFKIGSGVREKSALRLWQFSNIPWYLCRLLRTYGLSGRILLHRSSKPQIYDTRSGNESDD